LRQTREDTIRQKQQQDECSEGHLVMSKTGEGYNKETDLQKREEKNGCIKRYQLLNGMERKLKLP